MAFKDTFIMLVETLITHNISAYTVSCTPRKKFSDLVDYIRKNRFGKSIAGNTREDTDNGYFFTYEYNFGGDGRQYYIINIKHSAETVVNFTLEYHVEGASFEAKRLIAKMEKNLPDFESAPAEEIPETSYSSNALPELVELFDKNLNEFAKKPSTSTLAPLNQLQSAIQEKINGLPLAQRSSYGTPLSNIGMYLDALKTQLNTGVGGTQFVETYVPQITKSLAELASLIG